MSYSALSTYVAGRGRCDPPIAQLIVNIGRLCRHLLDTLLRGRNYGCHILMSHEVFFVPLYKKEVRVLRVFLLAAYLLDIFFHDD